MKVFINKFFLIFFTISVFLLASPQKVQISEVIKNTDKYDEKIILVEGYIQNIKQKIS